MATKLLVIFASDAWSSIMEYHPETWPKESPVIRFPIQRGPRVVPAIKDPAIEEWAHYRENTHRHFRFTPKNARNAIIFMAIVPYLTYKAVRWSQIQTDEQSQHTCVAAVPGRRYMWMRCAEALIPTETLTNLFPSSSSSFCCAIPSTWVNKYLLCVRTCTTHICSVFEHIFYISFFYFALAATCAANVVSMCPNVELSNFNVLHGGVIINAEK